jgi:hypothetical protein
MFFVALGFSRFNSKSTLKPPQTQTVGRIDGDPEKSKRATDAMIEMQKIIVADLRRGYDGR